MEYKIFENIPFGKIGTVIRGPWFNKKDKQIKEENATQVKILNWPNLKKICEGEDLTIPDTSINISRKYKKDDIYLQKGDIVIPVFPNEGGKNVIYIKKDMQENYIYSELVFILRITDKSISSEYLYMLLSSDSFSKYLLEVSKVQSVLRYRLTNEILENMIIPILYKESMEHLLDEYLDIKKLNEKVKRANEEFNNKINKLIK